MNRNSVWPIIEIPMVFHLGSMQPSDKGKSHNANSLEGAGLSVSIHPRAWRQIARLGGQPSWGLSAGQGTAIRFVDAHALTSEHLEQMYQWGLGAGLVRSTELAVLTYEVCDEYGESTQQTTADLLCHGEQGREAQWRLAQEELAEMLDSGEEARLEIVSGYAGTELLATKSDHKTAVPPALVRDLLLTVYSDEVLRQDVAVDGVWWADDLDVHALSAPRGVVHPAALPTLHIRSIEDEDLPFMPLDGFSVDEDGLHGPNT